MNSYPEHEKLEKIQELSQSCGEFIDWLRNEKNLVFAKWVDVDSVFGKESHLDPCRININRMLSEFFEIDQERLEQEKIQMIREIVEIQRKRVGVE